MRSKCKGSGLTWAPTRHFLCGASVDINAIYRLEDVAVLDCAQLVGAGARNEVVHNQRHEVFAVERGLEDDADAGLLRLGVHRPEWRRSVTCMICHRTDKALHTPSKPGGALLAAVAASEHVCNTHTARPVGALSKIAKEGNSVS